MNDLAAARFDLIAPLLSRYRRRFTLLDLGAGINPYMAQRISREFDCVCIAVEQDEIIPEELAKFGPRALWLRKKMSAEDLKRLACCEHFDVVLALNVLHWFDKDWMPVLKSIRAMSNFSIVQTPYRWDLRVCGREVTPEIEEYLSYAPLSSIIGESVQFDQHQARPIFKLWNGSVGWISSSSWTSPKNCVRVRVISSVETSSVQVRNDDGLKEDRPYIHGLNLWNFAQLNGQWPRKEAVLKMIREFPLPAEHHGDITPHNFLFDGAELHLIDGHEGWEFDDRENLLKAERMMEGVLQ